ncbi:MAG: hypothetical protein HY784_02515, partial [Chloroflexi bacterium]|nr:hypothetical protein [Chloroflexota bacterium]
VFCVLALCCLCLALVAGGAAFVILRQPTTVATATGTLPASVGAAGTPTPHAPRPTPYSPSPTPVPVPQATAPLATLAPSAPSVLPDTLETLRHADVPLGDLRALAERLKGIENIPEVVATGVPTLAVGALKSFNAANVDSNSNFTVRARLAYVTDHVYFWVEEGLSYNEGRLQRIVDRFENQTYPTDREFFGSEWTPGVDGDPHLYMLYARGLGNSVAGYYSSADEYSHLAHPFSNEVEIFYLNADNIRLGAQFTDGVLAHEFQHMIHWYQDRNEETWMNEGFSEVAAFFWIALGARSRGRLYTGRKTGWRAWISCWPSRG